MFANINILSVDSSNYCKSFFRLLNGLSKYKTQTRNDKWKNVCCAKSISGRANERNGMERNQRNRLQSAVGWRYRQGRRLQRQGNRAFIDICSLAMQWVELTISTRLQMIQNAGSIDENNAIGWSSRSGIDWVEWKEKDDWRKKARILLG